MKSRKTGQCDICGDVGELTDEHIIPSWLFKHWEKVPVAGPFTMTGSPTSPTRRDGRPVTNTSLERVLLDVCAGCNSWLNRHFEEPAKTPIRQLCLGQSVSGPDMGAVARWAVKTLVLYGHPSVRRSSHLSTDVQRPMLKDGAEVARVLRTSGEILADVSLWATAVDRTLEPVDCVVPERLWPSRTGCVDGSGGSVGAVNLGLGALGLDLTVMMTLVVHPLVDIENPWEAIGLATRIWPNPPERLALTDLPAIDVGSGRRSVDWISDSGLSVVLEPGERRHADHPLARMMKGLE